jgi:hypothetical protein
MHDKNMVLSNMKSAQASTGIVAEQFATTLVFKDSEGWQRIKRNQRLHVIIDLELLISWLDFEFYGVTEYGYL